MNGELEAVLFIDGVPIAITTASTCSIDLQHPAKLHSELEGFILALFGLKQILSPMWALVLSSELQVEFCHLSSFSLNDPWVLLQGLTWKHIFAYCYNFAGTSSKKQCPHPKVSSKARRIVLISDIHS